MSAAVGAALKKIAVAVLSDPKALKKVLTVLLVLLLAVLTPGLAVVAFFNGTLEFDKDELKQQVVQNLSMEEQTKLQAVEFTMRSIEIEMTTHGFASRIKEAQVLYTLGLSDFVYEPQFVLRLVGCFSANQTDEQLVDAVNAAFGTQLLAEDFQNVMNGIRQTVIDTSMYVSPDTKNNLDLVQWAIGAEKAHWGYVYGTYGTVLSKKLFEEKLAQYPNEVGSYEDFIQETWLGGRTADCVGLIKGYSWYDPVGKTIMIGTNGMPDISADAMFENTAEKGSIDTIPELPGLAVWQPGHIGVYIGNGEVIEAMGTKYGVVRTQLTDGRWTHWLKIPYISYMEQEKTA